MNLKQEQLSEAKLPGPQLQAGGATHCAARPLNAALQPRPPQQPTSLPRHPAAHPYHPPGGSPFSAMTPSISARTLSRESQ